VRGKSIAMVHLRFKIMHVSHLRLPGSKTMERKQIEPGVRMGDVLKFYN